MQQAHNHCNEHHHHHHHHGESRLVIALFLTCVYMVVEAVGGFVFNSLALLADAGHMLSDVVALALSLAAIKIGNKSPTERHTFGFRRTEILAALANGLALWAIVVLIFFEAVHRFYSPQPVQGGGMLLIAGVGLGINAVMALLLFSSRHESLNIKGAFVHVISDALGSLGAIVAAVIILQTDENRVDPAVSILVGCLIVYSSWSLIRESLHILMEGVPAGLNIHDMEQAVINQDGVCCIYDLHVWTIGADQRALSAHVVVSDPDWDRSELLKRLNRLFAEEFNVTHTTIQIEPTHEIRSESEYPVCREGTACKI
ncbi:MAG: cation transporter [Desulfomonile tiedjei]|uniref:Cation transporter n=1 Tax=Desulfomonile tiedjei TaxID=2358 RepID=A0A9D6V290_9BACT|nr:cation transporter [Desulfomonile tiedjei]